MKISLILACAGKGERVGHNKNKLLVPAGGETCLQKTFSAFQSSGLIDEYVIACAKSDEAEVKQLLPPFVKIVIGGETRTRSVVNALAAVTGEITLIHDGARPFVDKATIKSCIQNAEKFGSGIAAVPSRDTICRADNAFVTEYAGKSDLFIVQTPQAFRTELIKKAYRLAEQENPNAAFNDDGEVFEKYIAAAKLATGAYDNVKITYKEDLGLLSAAPLCRVGTGFDCHKLVENRKLILGGVEIPHDKGLLGHSDADVLAHAVMDALLSALSLRDIGYHFPDSDPAFKNANSISLLKRVLGLITEQGYAPHNVSAVIMADKPKLSPYIEKMTETLAEALGLPTANVGLGATTLEGLGFVGREEGICVHASATVIKK